MISNKLMIAKADQLLYSDRLAKYNEYIAYKQQFLFIRLIYQYTPY